MKRHPSVAHSLDECRVALGQIIAELEALAPIIGRGNLRDHSLEKLEHLIGDLAADNSTPYRLPRLAQIEEELSNLGLDAFKQEIRTARATPSTWSKLLEHAWLSSLLERARAEDSNLGGFVGRTHQHFRDEFCSLDKERLNLAVQRVRRGSRRVGA